MVYQKNYAGQDCVHSVLYAPSKTFHQYFNSPKYCQMQEVVYSSRLSQKLQDNNNDLSLFLIRYRSNVWNLLVFSLRDSRYLCCHKYYQLSWLLRVLFFLTFQSDDSQRQSVLPTPCPQPQSKPYLHRYACQPALWEFKQAHCLNKDIFSKYITTKSNNMLLFKSL